MVRLSRIYTGVGDGGSTRLGSGDAVPKSHPRIEAYGTVDELNSALGATIAEGVGTDHGKLLHSIQNDLFDVGADLCLPLKDDEPKGAALRVRSEQVERLESAIDGINENLEPLQSFVLPGGSRSAAQLHVARTICRRAERCVWQLVESDSAVNPQTAVYLNRLSDLLFVMARAENVATGAGDVMWEPGKTQQVDPP